MGGVTAFLRFGVVVIGVATGCWTQACQLAPAADGGAASQSLVEIEDRRPSDVCPLFESQEVPDLAAMGSAAGSTEVCRGLTRASRTSVTTADAPDLPKLFRVADQSLLDVSVLDHRSGPLLI